MKRYITSNFDSDATDSWDDDEFGGKKYFVFGKDRDNRIKIKTTDNPETAISDWFRLSRYWDGFISAKTRNDAIALVTAGTPQFLTSLYNKYGSRYKLDYLIDACKRQRECGCSGLYESRFGDQVDPFSVG